MQKIQYVTRLQRETKSPPTPNVYSRTLLGGGWMVPLRNECLECDHRSDSFSSSPTTPPPAMYSFNGKGCGKNPQTIVVWIIDQVASKEAKQQQHHQHQNCSRCVNRENLCIYIVIFLLRKEKQNKRHLFSPSQPSTHNRASIFTLAYGWQILNLTQHNVDYIAVVISWSSVKQGGIEIKCRFKDLFLLKVPKLDLNSLVSHKFSVYFP